MDFDNYRGIRFPHEQLDVGPLDSDGGSKGTGQESEDEDMAMAKLNGEKDALGALAVGRAISTKLTPDPASAEYQGAPDVVED
jgi:hypothetical protein